MKKIKLENRSQVSTEYLVLLSVLGILTVLVSALAFNIIKIKEVAKIKNNIYSKALLKMI